jgi:hypothetical protein
MLYNFSLFFWVPPRTLRDITSVMLWRFPFASSAVRYSNFVKFFKKCRIHLKIVGAERLTQWRTINIRQTQYEIIRHGFLVPGIWPPLHYWLITLHYDTIQHNMDSDIEENFGRLHSACSSFHYSVCMSCLTLSSRPCSFNILCACLVCLSRITWPSVQYRKLFPLFFTFCMACWVHWYLCR